MRRWLDLSSCPAAAPSPPATVRGAGPNVPVLIERLRHHLIGLLIVMSSFAMAGRVEGDSFNALARFDFSDLETTTKLAGGETTRIRSDLFLQQYNLHLLKQLYPNLSLRVGGLLEDEQSIRHGDFHITTWRPFVDLIVADPLQLYTASVGYDRWEERTDPGEAPPLTETRENYKALLGWRPEGLPSFDVRYLRTNTFDKRRELEDRVRDFVSGIVQYVQPLPGLDLRYRVSYTDESDDVARIDRTDLVHNANLLYAGRFFDGRLLPSASYTITQQTTETTARGTGEVTFEQFPTGGVSAIDETPDQGELASNPALIDRELIASAGLNLGRRPSTQGDQAPRNFGLDFFIDTAVDTLFVWVDRELPASIASSFTWEVWVSSDNENWTLARTVPSALFGAFENRFEIRFPAVTARYIKVTTRPLSLALPVPPGFELDDIFVTELQAFVTEAAGEGRRSRDRMNQVGNFNLRARVLNRPLTFYDLSYWFVLTDPGSGLRDVLSNGVFTQHVFNPVFSAQGRFAVENGREPQGTRFGLIHTASLLAVPLRNLRHALVYSGRNEEVDGFSRSDYTLTLNNYAQIYKGVDLSLIGGASFPQTDQGSQVITQLTAGAGIIPHPAFTFDLHYTDRTIRGIDTPGQRSSRYTRIGSFTATYQPFSALYLLGALDAFFEKDRATRTTQNYNVSWSPFPDGTLQFQFAYNDTLISQDDRRDRVISPLLRWNVTPNMFLDLSYSLIDTDSDFEETRTKVANVQLQINL